MPATLPRVLLATALMVSSWVTLAAAQSNPCSLLTSEESIKHIARDRETYSGTPDAYSFIGGAVCIYPYGGEIGLWPAPSAEQHVESFLKYFKVDKAKRHPVSGVGDSAWIMFPVQEDLAVQRGAYVVARVGQHLVTVTLFTRGGWIDRTLRAACREGEIKTARDKEDCKSILADPEETQESLQPAVEELARLVVAKVRSGKGL